MPTPADETRDATVKGQLAGRAGKPHTDNPFKDDKDQIHLHLVWFHAWHVAKWERLDAVKFTFDQEF